MCLSVMVLSSLDTKGENMDNELHDDICKHVCWECGKKAKWRKEFYSIKHGFHSILYFCNDQKCHDAFYERNEGKLTQTHSEHAVN